MHKIHTVRPATANIDHQLVEQALALAISHMAHSSKLSKAKCRELLSQHMQQANQHHSMLQDAPIITANESSFISALFSA